MRSSIGLGTGLALESWLLPKKYGELSSFDLGGEIDVYVPAKTGRLWGVTGRLVGVRHILDGDERVTRVTVELGDGQVVNFVASSDSHFDGVND